MKKLFATALLFSTLCITAQSQSYSGFESLLIAAENDSKALVGGYLTPALKGMNHSLNGGWYHTAKTHKKFGFDIAITGNFAIAPSKDRLFSIAGLENVTTASGQTSIPTIVGENKSETLIFEIPDYKDIQVKAPAGIKDDLPLNAIPAPMVQLGLGLPTDTDLIIRYMPTVNSEGVSSSLFGMGFKHNILQYLGPIDYLPLNVSIIGAFSNMSTDYDLQEGSSINGSNQKIKFKTNTFTIQALASVDFVFIDFYAGLGYGTGSTSLDILGTYDFEYRDSSNVSISKTLEDPISMKIKSKGSRATFGTRINLAFIKLFADYTFQEYNTFTAGIAFSLR